ncbi:unnamed protein product [Hermetia illucens]|uniref:Uncharacterized protein n=1 Tax=Hermetia illucens TaxID=343691 RepID=A0A7R8YP21_HERIL|nr:unnamed protein product [Hermetia illucens]
MATSSMGKFKNTAGPKGSERHAGFELTGDYGEVSQSRELFQRMIRKHKALMRTLTHFIQDTEKKTNGEHSKEFYELKINLLQKYIDELAENDYTIYLTTNLNSAKNCTVGRKTQ